MKLAINDVAGAGELKRHENGKDGGTGDEHTGKEYHRLRTAAQLECVGLQNVVEDLHTDIPKLKAGGLGMQFWSVYVPTPGKTVDRYVQIAAHDTRSDLHFLFFFIFSYLHLSVCVFIFAVFLSTDLLLP